MTGQEVARPTSSAAGLGGKVEYARLLAESGMLPAQYRGKPANLLWAVEYGAMLGLSPMAAITGVHVIEGKPSASAALISALVRRAGHRLRVIGDDQRAVATITRADDPDFEFRSEWTIDRAKQAKLTGKGVWQSYPAAMLKARAITEVARDACEDALAGLHYTPEELGADVHGDDAAPVLVQVDTEPRPDYRGDADAATTRDELRAVWVRAHDAGHLDSSLADHLRGRAQVIEADTADGDADPDVAAEPPAEAVPTDLSWIEGEQS